MPTPNSSRNSHFTDAMRGMGRTVVRPAAIFGGDIPLPAAPTLLVAESGTAWSDSGRNIVLTWQDNANNEVCFEIQRGTTGVGPFSIVGYAASVAGVGGTGTFTDKQLTANTTYYYRVRALNSRGYSAFSLVANATTLSNTLYQFSSSDIRVCSQAAPASNIASSVIKLYSDKNNDFTSNSGGFKTVLKLPGVLNLQAVATAKTRLSLGLLDISTGAQMLWGSGVNGEGRAFAIIVRATPIVADFAIGSVTWNSLAGLSLGTPMTDHFLELITARVSSGGYVNEIFWAADAVSKTDYRPLEVVDRAGVDAAYGFLIEAKIWNTSTGSGIPTSMFVRLFTQDGGSNGGYYPFIAVAP